MDLEKYITPSTVFVDQKDSLRDCVQLMIDHQVSSVLVVDANSKVIGIITERDIVRKFTLLDIDDKLERTAGTVMTRPIKFVRRDHLIDDIIKLHWEQKIRHFPILSGVDPIEENIVGMLSVTDVLRFFLNERRKIEDKKKMEEMPLIELGILSTNQVMLTNYEAVFKQLRYLPTVISDFAQHVRDKKTGMPIIFDLDSYQNTIMQTLTPAILKYPGKVIIVTANANTLQTFRKYIKPDHQAAAIKPLDFTYINWLLREHWGKNK